MSVCFLAAINSCATFICNSDFIDILPVHKIDFAATQFLDDVIGDSGAFVIKIPRSKYLRTQRRADETDKK